MSKLGAMSLASSLAGLFALVADVVSLTQRATLTGQPTVVDVVLTVADLTGLLFGLLAHGCGCGTGTAALHMSWVPLAVAFLALAAYRPVLAADLVKRLTAVVLMLFGGLADVLVELA